MSMKRTKQKSGASGRRSDDFSLFGGKDKEPEKNWKVDVAEQPEESFVPYALTSRFARGALIAHTSFGKGIVVSIDGPRMEVLFESGIKKLGQAAG